MTAAYIHYQLPWQVNYFLQPVNYLRRPRTLPAYIHYQMVNYFRLLKARDAHIHYQRIALGAQRV